MDLSLDAGSLRDIVLTMIIVIISLTAHEWGHAAMADKLGDHTPRSEGRVTMNPMAHIDLIGTIVIPFLGAIGMFGGFAMIGWAKPVYTNPANFQHRKRDEALVTIAGPGMNLILALLCVIGVAITYRFVPTLTPLLLQILVINVNLMVFNMLPIPPLDGSKFLIYWFGMGEEAYMRLAQYGGILLLVLINIPACRAALGGLLELALVPFQILLSIVT